MITMKSIILIAVAAMLTVANTEAYPIVFPPSWLVPFEVGFFPFFFVLIYSLVRTRRSRRSRLMGLRPSEVRSLRFFSILIQPCECDLMIILLYRTVQILNAVLSLYILIAIYVPSESSMDL